MKGKRSAWNLKKTVRWLLLLAVVIYGANLFIVHQEVGLERAERTAQTYLLESMGIEATSEELSASYSRSFAMAGFLQWREDLEVLYMPEDFAGTYLALSLPSYLPFWVTDVERMNVT